ncbi:asparagine synthetase B family protein [Noviherbaspirillum denitrificans]|uniref:asparagine synthase (glutamine-hydrolyzing) n=1 Tax=Noviherbaspirillum denitrificans TaxID=1968433 RepID=A0A254TLN4_9BURK|nr:asparagine synthase C-terminal domain-containing protein [Noviherbaspirillum denitrificans]OWW22242.1 asparagine synthase [Noviherbaspirillum denitrificans]
MSGVCGWLDLGAADGDKQKLIDGMAAPLTRFDASPVQALTGRRGALAVAAGEGSTHVYRQDGLLVALWGAAGFSDARLMQRAQAEGLAVTLAGLYRDRPDQVCTLLSGAFALCIIDEDAGEAMLAIDRMGTHSLTWQQSGNCLVFGSSADAIIRHPAAPPEIDPQALYNYVYFHMIPGPGTVYKGQQRLLPGECLVFRKGEASKRRYWQMQFSEDDAGGVEDHKEAFLELLRKSVREAMGGQKIGAFLSGGTDSSTIAGFLTEVGGQPAKTYSIGFEAEGYDEMEYARIASRRFGTDHHEYYVTPDDVVNAIPEIAGVFDQPFGNASAVPAFYCARMARRDGLTRMLGGDGGDELFGGNERYAKQHVFALYERVPRLIRKGVMEPAIFGMPAGDLIMPVRKARSYIQQASVPMPARLETYNLLERYGASAVFTPEFLAAARPDLPLALLEQTYNESQAQTLINRMLALDLKVTLADNDLPKVVKACELAGMEVAFPFLNDEMVAFSARLAPQLKLKGTKLRYFFKEALRGILPDEIITKQKHGFGLPFGVWLQRHKALRELATDSLSGLKARGIVRADFIDGLEQRLNEHAGYHGTMVWVLMMMEQWFRRREEFARF